MAADALKAGGMRQWRPAWTDGEIATLRALHAAGAGPAAIAAAIPGRSRGAVALKVHKLGLTFRGRRTTYWTTAQLRDARADYENPKVSLKAIGAKYGRTRRAIYDQAKKYRWQRRRNKAWTDRQLAWLDAHYPKANPPSLPEMARKLGHSCKAIYEMAHARGLKRHPEAEARRIAAFNAAGRKGRTAKLRGSGFSDVAADVLKAEEISRAFRRVPRAPEQRSYTGSQMEAVG